jgi:hypothetical protein
MYLFFASTTSSSMALQPGVGLGLLYNMPPSLSIPCSVSPFVYSHLSQVRGHVIQPSDFWSSSSSFCIQLSVHLFGDCGILHSFYMTKPSYSLAFNKPDTVLPLNHLTPNGHFSGRTAPLTYRWCIFLFNQQIYVLNILNMLHTPRFFLFKMPFIS